MLSFKDFMEAEVPMSAMRAIRKNLGRQYRPGTFGVEIEFRAAESSDNDGPDYDMEYARERFQAEVDEPQRPQEWERENPPPEEPEEPEESMYEWSDTDRLSNWLMLGGGKEAPPEGLKIQPPDISVMDAVFTNLPYRTKTYILHRSRTIIDDFLIPLYQGRDRQFANFTSEREVLRWRDKMYETIYTITAERIEQGLRSFGYLDNGGVRYSLQQDQADYLNKLYKDCMKAFDDFLAYHNAKAQELTPENYAPLAAEAFQKAQEKYEEDHEEWGIDRGQWEEDRNEIQAAWDNWDEDEEFERWFEDNEERFRNDSDGSHDVQNEIDDLENWMYRAGMPVVTDTKGDTNLKAWNIFEDESGVVEIASPILNPSNFGVLKTLLHHLEDKEFDSDTGCHVHIGMPEMTDAFDLLCMAALLDEEKIVDASGRRSGSLERYAKKKDAIFKKLITYIGGGIFPGAKERDDRRILISNKDLQKWLHQYVDRYYGVNLIQAFASHGTVEFRYLTSQIVTEPEKLFEIINYFLMLPRLAQGRTQIRHDMVRYTVIASRRAGGMVEIRVFDRTPTMVPGPTGEMVPKKAPAPSMPTTPLPVPVLRQPAEEKPLKQRLLDKFGAARPSPPTAWRPTPKKKEDDAQV